MLSRFSKLLSSRASSLSMQGARRGMGGAAHGHGDGGFHPHVAQHHIVASKFMLVVTYVWIMYRMKEDGAHVFGIDRPWYNLPAEGEEESGGGHH